MHTIYTNTILYPYAYRVSKLKIDISHWTLSRSLSFFHIQNGHSYAHSYIFAVLHTRTHNILRVLVLDDFRILLNWFVRSSVETDSHQFSIYFRQMCMQLTLNRRRLQRALKTFVRYFGEWRHYLVLTH